MAITKVRVKIDGVWSNATKGTDGKWKCTITSPAITSYNLPGKYYPITVEITNDAGTVATYDASSQDIGTYLRLVNKEKIKPVITLVSPTNGTYSKNNKQPITFKVIDETNGSGINLSSVALKIDSTTYTQDSPGMVKTAIAGGYQFVFTPQAALSNGSHTITINAADNDGNAATAVSSSFKIDTTPPTLSVTSPTNGLVTNQKNLTLSGTTNDATSSPVTVTATLNGVSVGAITVTNGTFSKAITAAEGNNTLVVKAKDSAGQETTVTITFRVDTGVPRILSAAVNPNPSNTSQSVEVVLEIV